MLKSESALSKLSHALLAVTLATTLALPASAFARDDDWVNKREKDPCANYKPEDDKRTVGTEQDTAAPGYGGNGDVFDTSSRAYEIATQIYDFWVNELGVSGAFACGVLANIKGESGFVCDIGEGGVNFGMNSKEPPAGIETNSGGTGAGGGGLYQFTPWSKFTDSEYWGKYESDGWGIKNQSWFVWDSEFRNGYAFNGMAGHTSKGSLKEVLLTSDPREAAECFQMGYERPLAFHPERGDWAMQLYSLLDGSKDKGDSSKLDELLSGDSMIDASSSKSEKSRKDQRDKNCDDCDKSNGKATYLELAKEYAADKSIGYSMDLTRRQHQPDMDCSSFVYYVLVDSGLEEFTPGQGAMPTYPWNTWYMDENLEKLGFTRHAYNESELQPGDILLDPNQHTEIVLGWYDLGSLDADGNPTETEKGSGTLISIGAHSDYDGVPNDGTQTKDGCWFGGEVDASSLWGGATYYFRPPDSALREGARKAKSGKACDDEAEDEVLDAVQKKIVEAAKTTPPTGEDMCAAWVSSVYAAAGFNYTGGNGVDQYNSYCKSSDKKDLKPGMTVGIPHTPWGDNGWNYGHVGIYVGDGMVMHNVGSSVATCTLEEWSTSCSNGGDYAKYGEVRWGFPPDVK